MSFIKLKLIIIFCLAWIALLPSPELLAQKKNVSLASKLIGRTDGLSEARGLLKEAMQDEKTGKDPKTYYTAGLVEWRSYDNDVRKKQINPSDASVKNSEMAEKILNGYNYFKKALELDTIKDKKGKIKPRYSREISELLVQYAYTLYRSGAIAYNGKKFYPDAYTGFVAGADIAGNIMPENAVTTGISAKVSPLFTDSLRALSYFYAGVSAYTADRQDEAMKAFADSERMNPRNSDMYVYMMSLLEKKILKDSVSISVHILADSLLAVSKRAYKLFGISNPLFLRRTVDILNRKGDSLESLDILNRQIELTPDSAFLYGLRAVTNELLAKDDDALLDYQRAAEKKGVSSSILLRGAYKYYEIGADRKNKIEGTRKQKGALRKAVLTDFMYPALELAKRAKEMSSDAQEKKIIDNLLENIDYDISVLK